jgi:hypothetical protein
MRLISLLILAILLVAACPAAAALAAYDSITVVRSVPATSPAGDHVTVTLELANTGSGTKSVDLTEYLSPDADFDKTGLVTNTVHHTGAGVVCYGANCSSPRPGLSEAEWTTYSYHWNVNLGPGEKKQISYWIAPQTAGDYWFRPAVLKTGAGVYSLPVKSITVTCKSGHACDPALGENSLTCPANCGTSGADNICNAANDTRCDPDCAPGADPDCTGAAGSLPFALIGGVVVVLLIVAGAAWYLAGKRARGKP